MKQLTPTEILDATINSAVYKSQLTIRKMLILGIIAGAYIALAGATANMASYFFLSNPLTAGIGKLISGILFPIGLIMVVLAGSELFTGNNLMVVAAIDKKITVASMLKNWIFVYLGNFIGSIIIAIFIVNSGLLLTGDGLLEEVTINIALSKVSLTFSQAIIRGILCNFLVCIAVWMAIGASTAVGKVVCIFFPICLFVTAGFEHSIANMYFIPVGIMADAGKTAILTWENFFINNLLPVTIGNIIGGAVFAGCTYYYAYKRA